MFCKVGGLTLSKHGEIRKTYEREYFVKNKEIDKKAKVVELSKRETYIVKQVYCGKCEDWRETDSRYFITDIFCPECCTDW